MAPEFLTFLCFEIFDILILIGNIKPQKSSCLPNIASCLPSGVKSQNILASQYQSIKYVSPIDVALVTHAVSVTGTSMRVI